MRYPSTLLLLSLLTLPLLTACGSTAARSITYQRTLEQTALVPAPSGPQAIGPLVKAGHVAVEGGATYNLALRDDDTRYQNKTPGNVSVDTFIWGRLSGGIRENVEVGIGFDYGHATWGSTAYAQDTDSAQLESLHAWRIGPQIRGIFIGDQSLGMGGQLEFEFSTIPHRRTVYEKAYETDFTGTEDRITYLGGKLDEEFDSTFYFFARAALFGTVQLGDAHLTFGGLIQNQPEYFGAKRADLVCTYYEDRPEPRCDGIEDTDTVDHFRSVPIVTLFLTFAYDLGPVTLLAQTFGHVASGGEVNRHTFMGFDAGARVSF